MSTKEFINQIVIEFGFEPTEDQMNALETFARFLSDRSEHCVMIMRGSAGTGKTSLAGAMVRIFTRLGQKLMLMAPTGRAAKVFSLNSGMPAFTIHRKIYREKSYTGIDGKFNLNDNMHKNTLFMIDEASMIGCGNGSLNGDFGSGNLLSDLIQYVYQGDSCRMMLVGDKAQLPPVGEDEAPALNRMMLEGYGMTVYECDLNEVLRQSKDSGILYNATFIRQMITHDEATELPKISFTGFADIVMMPGNELVESISSSYSDVGIDETMVITRSNKRANIYNQGIRNTILDREDMLCSGDMLMVVKNKYLETNERQLSFIANGDRVKVIRVRNLRQLYGFNFANVMLSFPDYDNYEIEQTVILDTLMSESPALTHEQSEKLYEEVLEDYADIPQKHDRVMKLKQDDYFNALQIKYAYAITCHKAQGGQWAHVYLDQGYMTDEMLTPDYIHWLYTAFTRATDKLFLVNWPKTQTASIPQQ